MNSNPNNNNNNKIVEMVYSLLEMLGMSSPEEMSTKLLLMSQSPQICHEMRQYGCLPLLIQLIHQPFNDKIGDKEGTMSSNESRNSDKHLDMSLDFDVSVINSYCGESNSQMNISTASANSSSFTVPELDVDPEPTDYSQRYKERPIDDLIAPRSTNKPEVAGCEDSMKVYKTEGTPLNFSLASSLSDLRECCLSSIDEEKQPKVGNVENSNHFKANDKSYENKNIDNKPKVLFKKPILSPEPKSFTSPKKPTIDGNESDKQELETKSMSFNENLMKSWVSINSIVSIDVSNENLCEETPLMYSRSSSLESLSDNEVKSVGQSSVVSEFSRRASEVVSPSDLPDSPLDSPRPRSPKPMSTSNESNNLCQKSNIENNCETNGNHNCIENNFEHKMIESTVFADKPISFATEDTPAVFSLSTSLSLLNEDLTAMNINEDNERSMKFCQTLEVNDINVEIMSTSSEDEDQLLAECISSGMKKISNETTISRNSLPKSDPKKVVNTCPSKPIPIAQSRLRKPFSLLTRSLPDGQSSYLEKSTLKVYGTGGSGVQMPDNSSINQLLIATNGKTVNQSVSHSDDSDDEEILQKCIASGMSANRNHHKLAKTKPSPKTPKTTPNASPNSVNDSGVKKMDKHLNADQTKRFFVEDTPIQML